MSRIVFLNDKFLPVEQAQVPIMDRGFLFGDGVYEACAVVGGKMIDNDHHLKRLERSLASIKMKLPYSVEQIEKYQYELLKQNNLNEGFIYLQVTRGAAADRDFIYSDELVPTFLMFTTPKNIMSNPLQKTGVKVATVPDIRWERRDIKSISLLAQVLAKNEAHQKGAYEAWLVEKGFVTEGASSNAFMIKDGVIITKNLSNEILHGVTRAAMLRVAKSNGLKIVERAFSVEEALAADECFITSSTNFVVGVVEIDGQIIGNGKVGEITSELLELYMDELKVPV